jgi:molybdate transport system substrate-binding protein
MQMTIERFATALRISSVILCAQVFISEAAELKLKVADPLTAVINELGPQFERGTGHKLVAKITPGPVVKRDIDAGEAFDLAISITPVIDDLIKQGKIIASSRADVAYSGIGVGMRRVCEWLMSPCCLALASMHALTREPFRRSF